MSANDGEDRLGLPKVDKSRVLGALFGGTSRPEFPSTLGRFQIRRRLGRGGMGTVLEAYDETLDRRLAIKLLRQSAGGQHQERLQREAQALARLSHPNVVQVFETGESDGRLFIAMELVQGQTLAQWQQRAHDWRTCVRVYEQAGRGLAAAHAQGIAHRDFKPANCIIDDAGRVKVLDFGLARGLDEQDASESGPTEQPDDASALDQRLTQTGMMIGTPAYMAPEQLRRRPADARSDQYSFCVSLYEALHGVRPFEGTSTEEREAGISPPFEPASSHAPLPRIPHWLRRLLTQGMAPSPDDRFADMDTLLAAIQIALQRPRRRRLAAAALGLTTIGIVLGHQVRQTDADCESGDALLTGVWDDERRQQVRAAILGTELSFAADTWERVEPRLDDYAHAWADKHTEVCEATRVHGAQTEAIMELRVRCLDSRRTELRATVDALAQADPARVEKAARLLSKLSGLARCDDVEALQAAVPPPEDPAIAEQVERERTRLEEARVLNDVGDPEGSEAIAQAVIDEAASLAYGPLNAEAIRRRGIARIGTGAFANAAEDLEEAFLLALQHEHVDLQLTTASSLASVLGSDLGEPEHGRQWGSIAQALAQRASATDGERSMVHNSLGAVALREGALDEALEHYQHVLAFDDRTGPPDDPAIGRSLVNIAVVLIQKGQLEDARSHAERALELGERALGPNHPRLTTTINTNAVVLLRMGRLDEALSLYRRSLSIEQEAHGPEHPNVGTILNNIGSVLLNQGHMAEGLTYLQRALANKERNLGPEHFALASTLKNIGQILILQGELAEASPVLERAVDIEQRSLGPEHFDLADTLNTLGILRMEQDRDSEAAALFERALTIIEGTQGPRHHALSNPLINLGNLRQAQGRLDEAVQHYMRSLSIDEEVLGPNHPHLAQPLTGLAQVALERDALDSAREHAERIVSILEASEAPPGELAEARLLLARALWPEPSTRSRADALIEQARTTLEGHPEQHADALEKIDRWLADRPGAPGREDEDGAP